MELGALPSEGRACMQDPYRLKNIRFFFQGGSLNRQSDDVGWRLGVLVCTTSIPQLDNNPMQLARVVESDSSTNADTEKSTTIKPAYCVSVCRQTSLGTFRFSNEYTSVQNVGDNVGSVDLSLLRFPTVISLTARDLSSHHLPDSLSDLQIDGVHIGLHQSQTPDVLLTSSALIHSLHCSDHESVWYRPSTLPVPLERVVLAMSCDPGSREEARSVVSRIYELSRMGPLVVQQDFNFTVGFEDGLPIQVNVLETFPTLQGRVCSSKTTIAILPTDTLPPSLDSSLELRPRAESASNFDLEGPVSTGDYVIEAITMSNFPLQNHFVILPKDGARRYSIQHCQNIWVSPSSPLRGTLSKRKSVIQLDSGRGGGEERERERTHMAIALLYEDTQQLERYLPPREFGQRQISADLGLAYLHPELLYYLYPETISPSRIFNISIKVRAGKFTRCIVLFIHLYLQLVKEGIVHHFSHSHRKIFSLSLSLSLSLFFTRTS